ncbi:hypothetical protein QFZ77_004734 [Paenibacillus sp. V4I3]|uniref:hypothetical protein n=1 Tax=unclassified Paenibacillus TaxID=185978 RepID=UPI0027873F21|nr:MULTISPECIES: hypothetical protein [unclassified Paenibacillus]MDQ0876075.1 hypothetical protein [Paenibacillus sp. V4I3]MDQ0887976.1 hypothetical protein [Paenibacillus sp. V4I9]
MDKDIKVGDLMEFPNIIYFLNEYRDMMQMPFTENIKLYNKTEAQSTKLELKNEIQILEEKLLLDDWEMDRSVALLCDKYNKKSLIKIVHSLKNEIKYLTHEKL